MSKIAIITLLESFLGTGKVNSNDNVAFHCPFCNHHKKKLEVNVRSQRWHCWICNAGGHKISILGRKLNLDRQKISKIIQLTNDIDHLPSKTSTNTEVLTLPKEFRPLWHFDKASPEYRNAVFYLRNRNINIQDILKYRIGYADKGLYSGKIIIPSFDANGNLNYFVSRAYYEDDLQKHRNPNTSKDIIGFELHINWNMPIVLVEGAFDAIAIKRNAIPLFGKTISNTLKKRIVERGVKTIYICLDNDAKKQALEACEYFMSNGIDVYLVDLPESDPSDMGFLKIQEMIENTYKLSTTELMQEKILCSL
jgi:DNA primase